MRKPSRLGFFSKLRDKLVGPGKRVFSLDEIKYRMARGDFAIEQIESRDAVEGMTRPAYFVRAVKLENAAEPAPQFLTAKENDFTRWSGAKTKLRKRRRIAIERERSVSIRLTSERSNAPFYITCPATSFPCVAGILRRQRHRAD